MAIAIGLAAGPGAFAQSAPYASDRILVRFAPSAAAATRSSARAAAATNRFRSYKVVPGLELLKVGKGRTVEQTLAVLRRNPNVLYAEPDYLVRTTVQPNDPHFGGLWGMTNIGAPAAWDIATGSDNVAVAIIDSGIDLTHPDLQPNIWTNPREIAGNRIDDDHNGFIDDVHGWDFVADDSDPSDPIGHGTHVAGTVGARGNNGLGVVGVNWRIKLVALRFINESGFGTTSGAIRAFQYALDNGIRISNNSWGTTGYSQAMYDVLKSLRTAGHLAVCSAGNDLSNTDIVPSYPASFDLDNVISVAALMSNETLWGYSNYGLKSVDLAAPGEWIYSTMPGGQYANESGTSMAAPHVTGAAALVLSRNPTWSYAQLRSTILGTVRRIPALSGKTATGGTLDLNAALRSAVVLPTFTLAPTVLDFDQQSRLGETSSAQTVTLTNTATVALPIRAINLSGRDSRVFNIVHDCGTSVAAGAACKINVRFQPVDGGARTATLTVEGGGGADSASVALSGTPLTPLFSLEPARLDFGDLPAGSRSAAQTVTLTNTGTMVLPIAYVSWRRWSFDVTPQNCGGVQVEPGYLKDVSLAVGASCTFSVVFTPWGGGRTWEYLDVAGDDGAGSKWVDLVGVGVAPQFTRAPIGLAFGQQVVGGTSAAQTVTVTNTGTLPLPVNSISLNKDQFGLTHTCGTSLAMGATCTISVVFRPTFAGAQQAVLKISGGNGAGGQNVGLTGTALPQSGDPPGALTVPVADPDGRYLVSWRASEAVGVTYVLEEAIDDAFSSGLRTVYEGPDLSAEINGRSTGTTYYYRAKAILDGSESAWVNGVNGCLVTNRRGARLQLISLPDVNSPGLADLAVLRTEARAIEVKDAWNGAQIGTFTFLNSDFSVLEARGLKDMNRDGSPELAVLAMRKNDQQGILEIRDVSRSDDVRQIWLASDLSPLAFAVIDDNAGDDGVPELAVLSVRDSDNRVVVQVINPSDLPNPRTIWGPAGYTPLELEVVPDADNNGVPDVAVLSTKVSDPRMLVQVRNADAVGSPYSMWFARNHTAIDLAAMSDTDADGVAEIAVLSSQDSDGRTLVALKNAMGPRPNEHALWMPTGYQALGIEELGPAPGASVPQVAVLLQRNTDGRALVSIRDAIGSAVSRSLLYPIGYTAHDFAILPDVDGSGSVEVAVLLTNDRDGRILVQRRNVHSYPWPGNYWFDH